MKKRLFLLICITNVVFNTSSRTHSENGILVYFADGVQSESVIVGGVAVKKSRITATSLQNALSAIMVLEDSIKPAFPHFNRADTLRVLSDGREIRQADMSRLYKIKLKKSEDAQKIIEQLSCLPEVLYAEPDGCSAPCVIPNDSHYVLHQWNMNNQINSGCDIHAEDAWNTYTGSTNNTIAIIDGGVVTNHDDLGDKIIGGDVGTGSEGWVSHGTHVAGIAAAKSNNGLGIAGVDWNARIHPQRIDLGGDTETRQAIVDAVNYNPNVYVLNNSYGLVYEDGSPGRYSTTVREAVAYAYKNNCVFVAAMGNHQTTHPNVIAYPAGYPNVITVGSTNSNDMIAASSANGNHIDVCAPGIGIYSTVAGNTYNFLSGTSMAAPHVAGLASLLKGYNRNLANDDIENIIKLSADKTASMAGNFDNSYGYGRINAERALSFLKSPYKLEQLTIKGGSVVNATDYQTTIFMGAGNLATAGYLAKRYEVQTTVTLPNSVYDIVGIWGRGVFTTGWNVASLNFGEGFCEVVAGSQTNESVILRTYVYEVYSISGNYLGYFPTSPSNVTFAYSVLGFASPSISGPNQICNETTYNIQNLPEGASIDWQTSSNITLVSNQGSNPCIFTNTYSLPGGDGWISALVAFNNNTFAISKIVQVGSNAIHFTVQRKDDNGTLITILDGELIREKETYYCTPFGSNLLDCSDIPVGLFCEYYGWEIKTSASSKPIKITALDGSLIFTPSECGSYAIGLSYNDGCGWSKLTYRNFLVVPRNRPFAIYPNPAFDTFTVGLDDDVSNASDANALLKRNSNFEAGAYTIQLWNEQQGLVRTIESTESQQQISLQGLPSGTYYVVLIKDGVTVGSQTLLKQ